MPFLSLWIEPRSLGILTNTLTIKSIYIYIYIYIYESHSINLRNLFKKEKKNLYFISKF